MLLLSRADIRAVLPMDAAIDAAEESFRRWSAGEMVVPQRTAIPAQDVGGTFLFMPCYCAGLGAAALKVVDVFPGNRAQELPSSHAQVLLIDGATGVPCALLDGTCVTQLRTAAAAGAALRALARPDAKRGALFGTGGLAATQLEAMHAACPQLREVAVYGRDEGARQRFAAEMDAALPLHVVPAASSADAVRDADVIVTATSSRTPVFDGALVRPGATVCAMGAYTPEMAELDAALLCRADGIWFDAWDAMRAEAGDLLQQMAAGLLPESALSGELGALLLGQGHGRQRADEILVFKSVGIGAQDLVAAKRIYDRAWAAGLGTVWG